MSHPPLAECKHIVDLRGYGWRLGQESVPFLVAEYAQYGTLRQFLLGHQSLLSGSERLQLCKDICNGLEELHLAGVAHGDLKLDNILVFADSDAEAQRKKLPVTVNLADFVYSLLLHHDDQNGEEQRYNGTELYANWLLGSPADDITATMPQNWVNALESSGPISTFVNVTFGRLD